MLSAARLKSFSLSVLFAEASCESEERLQLLNGVHNVERGFAAMGKRGE